MKVLSQTEVDRTVWDNVVRRSPYFRHYALSYFLDAGAESWSAMVWGDYEVVWPVPFKRWPFRRAYQPLLAQQLGPYSARPIPEEVISEGWGSIRHRFLSGYQKVNASFLKFPDSNASFRNIVLDLNRPIDSIRSGYNRNVRGNLKKAEVAGMQCGLSEAPIRQLVEMFDHNRGHGIAAVNQRFYNDLERVYAAFSDRGEAELWMATLNGKSVGGVAVLNTAGRLLGFFSAVNDEGRNAGAMQALFDSVFQTHAGKVMVFDFEGSNDENLAFFYRSFGGTEEVYLQAGFSRLPGLIQKLLP